MGEARIETSNVDLSWPFHTSLIMASVQVGRAATLKPAVQCKHTAASHPASPALRSRTFTIPTAKPLGRRSNMVVSATNGTAVQAPSKIDVTKKDTIEVLKASAPVKQGIPGHCTAGFAHYVTDSQMPTRPEPAAGLYSF